MELIFVTLRANLSPEAATVSFPVRDCSVLSSSSESLFSSSECSMKNILNWYERTWQGVGVCIRRTYSSGSLGHIKDSSSLSTRVSRELLFRLD